MAARRLSEERAVPVDFIGMPGDALPDSSDGGPATDARDGGRSTIADGSPSPTTRQAQVIGKRLRRLATAQLAAELEEQQTSLGISLYFERRNLVVWARRFRERSAAAFSRASRLGEMLAARQAEFELPAVRPARTQFRSPARALRAAEQDGRRANARLRRLSRAAVAKSDSELMVVAQWLVTQRVADERELRWFADLVASGANLFEVEALLAGIVVGREGQVPGHAGQGPGHAGPAVGHPGGTSPS